MRYSLEPHYRRHVQGQGFMPFARNMGNKYGKKLFDKNHDVSRNKEQKEDDRIMEETQEIIIPPEKREQIIKDLKLF